MSLNFERFRDLIDKKDIRFEDLYLGNWKSRAVFKEEQLRELLYRGTINLNEFKELSYLSYNDKNEIDRKDCQECSFTNREIHFLLEICKK